MTLDEHIRQTIRNEVSAQLAPLFKTVAALDSPAVQQARAAAQALARMFNTGPAPTPARASEGGPGCAVEDCARQARAAGYCPTHYQKLLNLERTKRAPPDWKRNAKPGTVRNVVLPRGRPVVRKPEARS